MTLIFHEIKMNFKSLMIWCLSVGVMCFGCLLLYSSIEESISQMADMYANMGSFSTAFGFDKIGMDTIIGFYATEIAMIFALGGAMFSALVASTLIAKEEEGHTSEFLHTLPIGRSKIVLWKLLAMLLILVIFNIVCVGLSMVGILIEDQSGITKEFFIFHGAQFLMQIEIASICFLLSALTRRKPIGVAIGISVLLYLVDVMCRIVPAIENLKYATPYYFSNGADIFSGGSIELSMWLISIAVSAVCIIATFIIYNKKDLAS